MTRRAHGTHACYVHGPDGVANSRGCRCDECRAANTAYELERSRRVAPAYVGAAAVREHIAFLRSRGLGVKTIAARAGVSHGAMSKIVYGDYTRGRPPSKRVRVETRDKILAVLPSDASDGNRVPAAATWENVDTLLERGWTKAAISRAIGQNGQSLQLGDEYVQARYARAVAALLDEPVPPRRSRFGEHPVDQPDEDDDEPGDGWPTDLPRPPKVDLTAEPWRRRAACRMDDVPVWLFFPGRGDTETLERAKAVCRRCPVRRECLEAHLDEREGVWGGTSERERREIRRERQDEPEVAA